MTRNISLISAVTLLLLLVGLSAVVAPWPGVIASTAVLAMFIWGILSPVAAVCILLFLAYFVHADIVGRSLHLRFCLDLFQPPIVIDLPFAPLIAGIVLCSAYFLFRLAGKRNEGALKDPLFAPFVFLLAYALVLLCWSPNLNWSLVWVLYLAVNICAYFLCVRVLKDTQRLKTVLWWLAIVGFAHNLCLIAFLFLDQPFEVDIPVGEMMRFYLLTGGGGMSRTFFENRAAFGWCMVLTNFHVVPTIINIQIAVYLALLLAAKTRARRIFLGLMAALSLFLSIYCDVRAGFLGLIGMVAFWLLQVPVFRRRLALSSSLAAVSILLCIVLGVTIGTVVSGRQMYSRALSLIPIPGLADLLIGKRELVTGLQGEMAVPRSRWSLWMAAWTGFTNSYGLGAGTEVGRLPERGGIYFHNLFLSVLHDYGIPGLLLLLWIGVTIFGLYRKVIGRPESEDRTTAVVLCGALVAIACQSVADFVVNDPLLWPTLGLVVVSLSIAIAGSKSASEHDSVRPPLNRGARTLK